MTVFYYFDAHYGQTQKSLDCGMSRHTLILIDSVAGCFIVLIFL